MARKHKSVKSKQIVNPTTVMTTGAGYFFSTIAAAAGLPVYSGAPSGFTIDASVANQMTISGLADKSIINWSSFNIDAGNLVKFIQPSTAAVVLNRDLSGQISQISGALQANGNVFLLNPAGVFFNGTAKVDVGGLVASTRNVSDADFNSGVMNFKPFTLADLGGALGLPTDQGVKTQSGAVINAGGTDQSGYVFLVAPVVDSAGNVTSHVASTIGRVVMAGADKFTIDITASGLVGFQIDKTSTASGAATVTNSGAVKAANVVMTASQATAVASSVVNQSGLVEATDLTLSARDGVNVADPVVVGPLTVASTKATTLNLELSGAGKSLGSADAALQVDAGTLNAKTSSGHVFVSDLNGGVAVGTIDAGAASNASVVLSSTGNITQSAAGTGIRSASVNLAADGGIGATGAPIKTETSTLLAQARDGDVRVSNKGGLLLGKVAAQQIVTTTTKVGDQTYVSASSVGVIDDGNGNMKLSSSNTAPTRDVEITTTAGSDPANKGDVVIADSLAATRQLIIKSSGSVLYTGATDPDQPQVKPTLTAKGIDIQAAGAIGSEGAELRTIVETVAARTTDGGVYISESNGLKSVSIEATKDISILADKGDIILKQAITTATGTQVSVNTKKGGIAGDNAAALNIRGEELTLFATKSISGLLPAAAITTSAKRITVESQGTSSPILLQNDGALDALDLTTSNGASSVGTGAGSGVSFDPSNGKLTATGASGLDLAFKNTAGNAALGGIDLGDGSLNLNVSGAISQSGSNPLIADSITLNAGTGIGAGTALVTQTKSAALTTTSGDVGLTNSNAASLSLTASTGAGNVSVKQAGDLLLSGASAAGTGKGKVTIEATGAVTGATGNGVHVTATGGADISGSRIDAGDARLKTQVSGDLKLNATAGAIKVANTGVLTRLDAAAKADSTFFNTGNVALGLVSADGKQLTFNINGDTTDANGGDVNIRASGLDFTGASFGKASDGIEISVDRLVINTYSGGIYAEQKTPTGPKLIKLETVRSQGVGADISIAADGDIGLGVLQAAGNNVVISSEGAIADTRTANTSPNVTARSLDISAQRGITGKDGGNLALSVGFLAASGGAGQDVAAENDSAVALDAATLTAKPGAGIRIVAPDITVLDEAGNSIQVNGGSIFLKATSGNIVFLDSKDTIKLTGGGSITLEALAAPPTVLRGYSGSIIVGNLTTEGGDISLKAESNITIGKLDTGSINAGNVTVSSRNGVILDGNGSDWNVRGKNVSLSAKTPSIADAEFNRSTAATVFEGKKAQLEASKRALADAERFLDTYKRLYNDKDGEINSLQGEIDSLSKAIEALDSVLSKLEKTLAVTQKTLDAAALAVEVGSVIAGAAQAIPLSGDGGSSAVFEVLGLALNAATFALGFAQDAVDEQRGKLDVQERNLADKEVFLSTKQDDLSSFKTVRDGYQDLVTLDKARNFADQVAFDASARIRDQAVKAYDLNKDIDSTALKPLGVTAARLDINAGRSVNTSVYLDGPGDLGLGNITLVPGSDLVVGGSATPLAGNISIVGTVQTSNLLDAQGAVTDRGSVMLQAQQAIKDAGTAGKIVSPDLIMIAGSGVGDADAIDVQVENLAGAGGSGGFKVSNDTGASKALNITKLGDVTGVSADKDISLVTAGNLNLKELVSDTSPLTSATVTLRSTGGAILDDNNTSSAKGLNVQANAIIASAKNGIELDTDAAELTASTKADGSGDIVVRETTAGSNVFTTLTVKDVSAGNGNVAISSGDLVVEKLAAAAVDTKDGNISLKSTGTISDDGVDTTFTQSRKLVIDAAGAVGGKGSQTASTRSLDTKVDSLEIKAGGVVNVIDSDTVDVVKVAASGDVTLQSLGGDLLIGEISAGTSGSPAVPANQVTLFATQGAIKDNITRTDDNAATVNVAAEKLALKAGTGVGTASNALDVSVAKLEAETDTGGIFVTDRTGDLAIANVTPGLGLPDLNGVKAATSGGIDIRVLAGSLTQDLEVSGKGDVSLKAASNVAQNADITTDTGNVTVTADNGSISMADGTATTVVAGNIAYAAGSADELVAKSGKNITTQVLSTKSGNITLTAGDTVRVDKTTTTGLGQVKVTAQTGSITIDTDAPVTATGKAAAGVVPAVQGDVTLTAKTGITQGADVTSSKLGNVTYTTATGDIAQNASIAAGLGNVTVTADTGSISMAAGTQTAVGLGNISYAASSADTVTTKTGKNITTQVLKTKSGDITLTAGGSVLADNITSTGLGQVAVTAQTGAITIDADAPVTATGRVASEDADAVQGHVTLTAKTGITQGANLTSNQLGNVTYTTATGDVAQNADILTATGNVTVTADTGSIVMAEGTKTAVGVGNISYAASSADELVAKTGKNITTQELSTKSGNITLTAGDSVNVNNSATTGLGQVKVTAQTGAITIDTDAPVTATGRVASEDADAVQGDVTLTAKTGITQGANLTSNQLGNVTYSTATGDVAQNANISTSIGNVTVTADTGSIAMAAGTQTAVGLGNISYAASSADTVTTKTGKNITTQVLKTKSGDITLTAGGSVLADNITSTGLGQVAVTAQTGTITIDSDAPVTATGRVASEDADAVQGHVTLMAQTGITQGAEVTSNQLGNVTYTTATGDVAQNASIAAGLGNVTVTADTGSIVMAEGTKTAVGVGNISYAASSADEVESRAGKSITTQELSTKSGNIALTAGDSVNVNNSATTGLGQVRVTAQTGAITIDTDAPVTATGRVASEDADAVQGHVTLMAQTGITQGADVTSSKLGNVTYTTATGDVAQNASISTGIGNVTVTADTGSIAMAEGTKTAVGVGNISYAASSADELVAKAGKNITTQALSTKSGNIALTAGDSVNVNNSATTGLGQVAVTAQTGAITIDADAPVTATGRVASEDADAVQGHVTLTAKTGITQGANLTSNQLGNVTYSTATGDVAQNADILADRGNIVVTARSGSIVMRNGDAETETVSANTRVSTTGNVSYTASDDIRVAVIETPNKVSLAAANGAVIVQSAPDLNVTADQLDVRAAKGIGSSIDKLKTNLRSLIAKVTGAGSLQVADNGDVELTDVSTAAGSATVSAIGSMTIDQVAAGGTGEKADLVAGGSITTLSEGLDGNRGLIKSDLLVARSGTGIDVDTSINSVQAEVTGDGNLVLREQDSVDLARVLASAGDVDVLAAGKIGVDSVQASGQVALKTTAGAIESSSADQALVARNAVLSATAGIGTKLAPLSVTVDTLDAATTGGNVVIQSTKSVALSTVKAGAGLVDVAVSSGDAVVDVVSASGDVRIQASNGAILAADASTHRITGATVELSALGNVGDVERALKTRADNIVVNSSEGRAVLEEADGVSRVDASATKGLSFTSVTGNVGVGVLRSDATVSLTAKTGAITDVDGSDAVNVYADHFDVVAATGIGSPSNYFDVSINSLNASSAANGVYIYQLGSQPLAVNGITAGGGIGLKSTGVINQQGDVVSSGGDITVNAATINMLDGVTTKTSGLGGIAYVGSDMVSLSRLVSPGGKVAIKTPLLQDNLATGVNIVGYSIDIDSPGVTLPQVKMLIGDEGLTSALLNLNYIVIGGTIANSRQFMDGLLRDLLKSASLLDYASLGSQFMSKPISANINIVNPLNMAGTWMP